MKNKFALLLLTFFLACSPAVANDLTDIKKRGVLRHLGVPYANFIDGSGGGLSVEMMQLFAKYLGVQYQYVETTWSSVIPDLVGRKVIPDGENVIFGDATPIKGDVIANGLTILDWRQKAVAYSHPTFPTQVWLISGLSSDLRPISPSGDLDKDIAAVKALLPGREVLGKADTCLDPSLYRLQEEGTQIRFFPGGMNELAPAVIKGESETAILDVPDALVALGKWPGQFKIIGPLSPQQQMGVAFRPDDIELLEAFNGFFRKISEDGRYLNLVKRYYPDVLDYYPDFFSR
ncbi:transporter substrate-binding domain-containing protein [Desulfopila aestuarii]|uniref:Amino acid ABC transporter substrate-binding protein, PAAT family n=1 Tax=Desulfopila aestuarii DSM 18488 TaxID=1121416 RepID=A0A1M7YGB2_9BACT|nr:transporter substrate-binding domain-containing protein [Desulfopila aestuarii]SHO51609.1 amino acid ABC transporter substrate-binding protein, PAAT family [Desulfopila aestuarii DSM 18488]